MPVNRPGLEMPMCKPMLNARETMRLLRISRETLGAMLASGELCGFERGKVIRVSRQSIERLLGIERSVQAPESKSVLA